MRLRATSGLEWGRDPKQNVQTGHTAGPRLAAQTLEHWNLVMEINAPGVFLGTKAAVPAMQRAGGGSIINISSICGIVGSHANAAYHASKGAVRIFPRRRRSSTPPTGSA